MRESHQRGELTRKVGDDDERGNGEHGVDVHQLIGTDARVLTETSDLGM